MTGYFDSLADVLPQSVIDKMHKALTDATWHGKGREDEPALFAGLRELIDAMVLRTEHDKQIQHHVDFQRSEAENHRRVLSRRVEEVRDEVRLDLHRLGAVRQLAVTRRKTVAVEDLRHALERRDCGTVTVHLPDEEAS